MTVDIKEYIKNLRVYGIKKNIPNIGVDALEIMKFILITQKPKKVLEIGMANGFSTINISITGREWGLKIDTYETSIPSYLSAIKNFKELSLEKDINVYNKDFLKCDIKGSYDFVFMDAMKSEYVLYWKKILGHLNKNSIIFVDNMGKFKQKTNEFYNLIMQSDSCYSNLINLPGGDAVLLIGFK